ncbi:MAG: HD domain-containing protein [Ardenticatenaceae bacterium]|nr:HD domain-containing protein [Ardenticatenaceae bacterium]
MIYHDSIYGPTEISEPVLIDLINSRAVQRLHGVLQHGISGLIDLTPPITRFEHSMGAMMVVRRLGGALSEQIAALLHDVSHTAFSHVIDHVFDSAASQAYHEEVKESYVAQTDLPHILQQYGYNWHDFLEESPYPLLEQPAPRLCADRLDYFLRDATGFNLATAADVSRVLDHLAAVDGRMIVTDLDTARWMGETFIKTDDYSWSNFHEVGLYECTARALRYAFSEDHLNMDDLWLTDAEVWKKLNAAADPQLRDLLEPIRPDVRFVWDETTPEFVLSTKIRTIDPDVWHNGEYHPLSHWDPSFGELRLSYVARKNGVWKMSQKKD